MSGMKRQLLQFTLPFALALIAYPASAFDRSVTFCNRTTTDVNVAVGADFEGTSGFTSTGWFKTSACTCRTVLDASLRATEVFVYAKWMGTRGNVLSNAAAPTCVKHGSRFDFVAENANQSSCESAGGSWENYKFYDTAANSGKTINLRRTGECNLMGDN